MREYPEIGLTGDSSWTDRPAFQQQMIGDILENGNPRHHRREPHPLIKQWYSPATVRHFLKLSDAHKKPIPWAKDQLRHSFGSYHLARGKNPGETAFIMENSPRAKNNIILLATMAR